MTSVFNQLKAQKPPSLFGDVTEALTFHFPLVVI